MDSHRRVEAGNVTVHPVSSPFSFFAYTDNQFGGCESIHRCCSLARSHGVQTVVEESIPAVGLIADENAEITEYEPDHTMVALKRVSFWTTPFASETEIANQSDEGFFGYAILKHDRVPAKGFDRWHVFEAVFRGYANAHNCTPCTRDHHIRVGPKEFRISGRLYAQQNGLNKICAHVAMRSLLAGRVPAGDLSYRAINKIVRESRGPDYRPAEGFGVEEIREILHRFSIPFRDIDYAVESKTTTDIRTTHPYRKFIYAGIESGCGSLLGFRMAGPKATEGAHIVPFFGHTFNKDTWVPDAEMAYFNIGGSLGYIPSDSWTGSFIGHDDNIGPNLCVPRLYVDPAHADYALELLPDGVQYGGAQAEGLGIHYLYSLLPSLSQSENPWVKRLAKAANPEVKRVVFRAVCLRKERYIQHLSENVDWAGNRENPKMLEVLQNHLPAQLWVVEASLPHLFPANLRKVGEILLDPEIPATDQPIKANKHFLMARLPGSWAVMKAGTQDQPDFLDSPSAITTHFPLLLL